jgi:hypothetical protein
MYKLRIYKIHGCDKGNLSHEEFFETLTEAEKRYKEFYIPYSALNPTIWIKSNNDWERLLGY